MIDQAIERQGIAKILSYLNKNDLNELVLTVTNRLILNFKDEESVPLILNYSKDALHFLKKKKIRKEFIFNYLKEQEVYVNSTSTKSELIRECLKYWGSASPCEEMDFSMDYSDEDEVTIIESNSTVNLYSNNQNTAINPNLSPISSLANHQLSNDSSINHQLLQCPNNQLPINQISNNEQIIQMSNNSSVSHQLANQYPNNQASINQISTNDQIIQLALEFGKWFFSALKDINNGSFDVNNFWPDSQLKVQFEYGGNWFNLSELGNQQNLNLLSKLISSNLKFKPNLLPQFDGVRAKLELHGLLNVIISGILYLGDDPIGWFESCFGLIPDSDLNQHNWRIKFLQMKLKFSKPVPNIELLLHQYKQIKGI